MWRKQEDFNRYAVRNQHVGFKEKPVTLASGRESHFYINWRTATETAHAADILTDYIISFIEHHRIDATCVYGVPDGATKAAIITTFKLGIHPGAREDYFLAQGRAEPKEHGDSKDKFFVGQPRGKTVILEDVTTTGSSLLTAIDRVRSTDAEVVAAISLTDRMERREDGKSVAEAIKAREVPYFAMSEAPTLLKLEYAVRPPSDATARAVEEEFALYGIKPVRLG